MLPRGLQLCQRNSLLTFCKSVVVECSPIPSSKLPQSTKSKKGQTSSSSSSASPTTPSPSTAGTIPPLDPSKEEEWNVVLDDTVLFPEGGGQPSDWGWMRPQEDDQKDPQSLFSEVSFDPLDGQAFENLMGPSDLMARWWRVVEVKRDDRGVVVHRVRLPSSSIPSPSPGLPVHVKVEWGRRRDHMQQHSAQHLISAIAERKFGWDTSSWWLGSDKCNIEFSLNPSFPSPKDFSPLNFSLLEKACNHAIQAHLQVTVKEEEEKEEEEKEVKTLAPGEKLARDSEQRHHGTKRTVLIGQEGREVDENPCCGTHVQNTSDLAVIKFLGFEKARSLHRLFFVAGDRVLNRFDEMFSREISLKRLLSSSEDVIVPLVDKSLSDLRAASRSVKNLQSVLCSVQAQQLIEATMSKLKERGEEERGKKVLVRYDGDEAVLEAGSMIGIAREVCEGKEGWMCLFTISPINQGSPDIKRPGNFLLYAPFADDNQLKALGKILADGLEGKGGGRNGIFQGKGTLSPSLLSSLSESLFSALV